MPWPNRCPDPPGTACQTFHRIDNEEFYRRLDGVVIDDTEMFNDKLDEWQNFYNFDRPQAVTQDRQFAHRGLGEVHATAHPLAVMETRFIEQNGLEIRHTTGGPCQTDDLVDATTWMVWHLANSPGHVADQFSAVHAHVSRLDDLFGRFYREKSSYGPIVASSYVRRPSRRP